MGKIKLLPYGISDFEDLRRQNRYYADKTMYIPKLEEASNFLFLIRPRRFGKSIFLSMLRCYYDLAKQDKFDELFDGLWIKDNPTEGKGQYQVLYLDFSQATVGSLPLKQQFDEYCCMKLESFADTYQRYYDEGFVEKVRAIHPDSATQMKYICDEAKKRGHRLYLIIDEYDNFTNNVLNEHGEAVYHALTHATGFYREVFKIYKANFQRILMMGVSPVTLDDLTSGFNIALNISTHPYFNMMLGFSETDVRKMIQYYKDEGAIDAGVSIDALIEEMRPWYDNYCFAPQSYGKDPSMFNCNMVVYYLRNYIELGEAPEQMLDVNTRTDYKKLKKLVELDGMTDTERGYIGQIAAEGFIISTLNTSFPAERIFDKENFISLLYYYGMLTVTGRDMDELVLGIPNNNVRKQYYEYMLTEYEHETTIDISALRKAYRKMSRQGDIREALTIITEAYKETAAVRNGIEGERNAQGFLTAFLSLTPLYLTAPETELNHGYCDIFLMPDKQRYPEVAHSFILELKYLPSSADDAQADRQRAAAAEQIRRYAQGRKVRLMAAGTTLHLVILQMRGCEVLRMEEVKAAD